MHVKRPPHNTPCQSSSWALQLLLKLIPSRQRIYHQEIRPGSPGPSTSLDVNLYGLETRMHLDVSCGHTAYDAHLQSTRNTTTTNFQPQHHQQQQQLQLGTNTTFLTCHSSSSSTTRERLPALPSRTTNSWPSVQVNSRVRVRFTGSGPTKGMPVLSGARQEGRRSTPPASFLASLAPPPGAP
eukprot:351952-Chlamydomonas_euryale.AAC.6